MKHFSNIKKNFLGNSIFLASSLLVINSSYAETVQFNPAPLLEQIARPGVGFQDPVRIIPTNAALDQCIANGDTSGWENNSDELAAAGLVTGAIYFRVMWQYIEPNNNDWQFDRIEKLLQCANKKGRAVDLRVMLTSPTNDTYKGLPAWLEDDVQFDSFWSNAGSSYSYRVPNFDNPVLKREHDELIRALGKRFDGHKDLNSVDIGSVGSWGEWHYLGYPTDDGRYDHEHPDFMPHPNTQESIIKLYTDSFPTTPLIALEGAHHDTGNSPYTSPTANYLRERPNIGWRADSWGIEYFNDRYNNLVYSSVGLENTWKTGMVSLEISGDRMELWPDILSIRWGGSTLKRSEATHPVWESTQRASNWHVSTINSKLGAFFPIGSSNLQKLHELSAKMGYRLALKQATFTSTPSAGSNLNLSMDWQNFGLAPLYRNFVISFRLKDSNGNVVYRTKSDKSLKGITSEDGVVNITPSFTIPNSLAAGDYKLETALVFNGASNGISYENDYTALAPIAIEDEDRRADKWVQLGELDISSSNSTGGSSIQIPSDYLEVDVPSNTGAAGNIIDGSSGSNSPSWYNTNGTPADAYFEINMTKRFKLTSLNYTDASYRNLEITVFDGSNQVSTFNKTHHANDTTFIPVNNGNGIFATRIRVRNPHIFEGKSWIAPIEVTLNGIQVEADYQRMEPGNENSLTSSNPKIRRIDDNTTSTGSWNNGGLPNEAHVDLYLDRLREIFAITYQDEHPRKLQVGVWNNGQQVLQVPFNTQAGYNELTIANIEGDTVKIWSTDDYLYQDTENGVVVSKLWIAPQEINVYGYAQ